LGDTGFFQFRSYFLTERFRQIDSRIVHDARGAQKKGLDLGQFRLGPIKIRQGLERLFDVVRPNDSFRTAIEWSAIEEKSERDQIRRAMLLRASKFVDGREKKSNELGFRDWIDSFERSSETDELR